TAPRPARIRARAPRRRMRIRMRGSTFRPDTASASSTAASSRRPSMGSAVAASMQLDPRAVRRAGVGLRLPHLLEVAAAAPPVGWLEIHPENFLANPHAREVLLDIASRCALSLHTVGVSVGSADGLDRGHLSRIASLVDELDPIFVSGHLAWSTHRG